VAGQAALLSVALVLVPATHASAYWSSAGSGVGSGTTGTLTAPTGVNVPGNSLSAVAVSWTASAGSPTPDGYYVTRTTGGSTVAACASSVSALLTGTSCTDSGVPDGTYTYTVIAKYRSWTAAGAPSGGVTVWTPTKLAVTGQPTTTIAGTAITPAVAVTVQTTGGVAVPLAGRSVTVAISTNPGGGTLSGTLSGTTNSSGVATFGNLSIDKSGTGYTLGATSSGLTSATSSAFTISAASADRFAITSTAVTGTAAASPTLGPITVAIRDAFGNAVNAPVGGTVVNLGSNSIGTARFAATSGGATITTVTIPAGSSSANVFYGDEKAGGPTITASGTLASATQGATINAGTATKFAITSAPITAGVASATATIGPLTVQRQDSFGNPATPAGTEAVTLASNSTGTKFFSATSGGSSTTTVTIPANSSSVNFYYADTKAGTPTITVSGALMGTTQNETILAAAPSTFLITSGTVSGAASTSATLGPITVAIQDSFGNTAIAPTGGTTGTMSSNTTGTAVFAATSGGSTTTTVTIPAGSSNATFYYGDTKAATPTVTVSGLTTNGTQLETISAAVASMFKITSTALSGIASSTTGTSPTGPIIGPITVQRQDTFGNPAAPASAVTVNLASNSTGTKVFSATSGGSTTTSVAIASGSSSVNFYYGDTLAGTPTITVSGTLASDTQSETITAAAAFKLSFGQQPTNTAQFATITPALTARIEDQWGNLTTSTASVTIAIDNNPSLLNAGSLSGTKTRSGVAGVATFNDLSIGAALGLGGGNGYTLRVTSTGLTAVTSSAFNIT
jgi:hypothetical protein